MSGRRTRALKWGRNGMNRAERRRTIKRTATAPAVLAAMNAEIDRRDRRSIQRAAARHRGAKGKRNGRRAGYVIRPPWRSVGEQA